MSIGINLGIEEDDTIELIPKPTSDISLTSLDLLYIQEFLFNKFNKIYDIKYLLNIVKITVIKQYDTPLTIIIN